MKSVLLVHSNLHLSTDGPNLPLRRLIDQVVEETGCERLITTGTAGGIGVEKNLGDVVVGDVCHFNCQKQFADAPFACAAYPTTAPIDDVFDLAGPLVAPNLAALSDVRPNPVWGFFPDGIETTDFFAFDSSTDHFGLRAYDPAAGAVEMDDACFGLVVADRLAAAKPVPRWAAVRNVSDPQADVARYATFEDAAADMGAIYRRWGYLTTIPSAIVSYLIAVA
jgi:nucleoside phosphorylase